MVLDTTALNLPSSYGIQKAIRELLLADYSRKGFVDGRIARLPTISVRPGRPNQAVSAFVSGIVREPLNGEPAVCPVAGGTRLWLLSPRQAIECLVAMQELPGKSLGINRFVNLPGISVSVDEMVTALRTVAGEAAVKRISWQRDPAVERIVGSWPGAWEVTRARALGLSADTSLESSVRAYVEDDLQRGFAETRLAIKLRYCGRNNEIGAKNMEKITADEAARLIEDGDAILISGSGGGHSVPEALLAAVGRRFVKDGTPRGLTSISVVGVGDRAALGASHLAHEGLLKRAITSALVDSPGLVRLAAENKIEAYTFPQGVLSQLMRDMAGGRPGLITKTGLHTFVDPRQQGARQSPCTPLDFVEVVNLAGEEWLFFKPIPLSVAFLRGTTADEDGNVTMEQEAVFGEMLAMAQATRRAGGMVIVQVKRMARRSTLPAKHVKIPGILVDFVVVDAEQRQTYATDYDPSYSGELRIPAGDIQPLPFGPRKIIVRRAAMELFPGAICNLGAGVSTGLSTVAAEEGLLDVVYLTNEQGLIGGAPITGPDSGGAQNFAAMIDQPAQFDFYDGGGLDMAFLSFAEVDRQGNVNISRFGDKIIGVGGFINISQNARCMVFNGTLTAGELDIAWENGKTVIRKEGRHQKFVPKLEQICYSASMARERGQVALFVTERAVFHIGPDGLELIEIAPGLDVERDVIAHMGFRPSVARDLRQMDARIFDPRPMGLGADVNGKSRRYRSPRVARWHAARKAVTQ